MALTASIMLPLGTEAPDFRLRDTENRWVARQDFCDRRGLVVLFICNHCPYVKHVRAELARLGRDYQIRGIGFVAINPNDPKQQPDDSPEKMKDEVRLAGYPFPYLFDESQAVAKAYHAACTPDIFLFDSKLKLAYRGQLDGSRPGSQTPVTGKDLRAALDAVLANRPAAEPQIPSMGCSIKWKPGGVATARTQ